MTLFVLYRKLRLKAAFIKLRQEASEAAKEARDKRALSRSSIASLEEQFFLLQTKFIKLHEASNEWAGLQYAHEMADRQILVCMLAEPGIARSEAAFKMMSVMIPCSRERLRHVTVQKSPVHGKGVFATKDIPEHVIVTFYPADRAVSYRGKVGSGENEVHVLPSVRSKSKDTTALLSRNTHAFDLQACGHDIHKHTLYGDPECTEDAAYCGHMINDASKPENTKRRALLKYQVESMEKHNCAFFRVGSKETVAVAIVSLCPISKGSELFVHYGASYWSTLDKSNTFREK